MIHNTSVKERAEVYYAFCSLAREFCNQTEWLCEEKKDVRARFQFMLETMKKLDAMLNEHKRIPVHVWTFPGLLKHNPDIIEQIEAKEV